MNPNARADEPRPEHPTVKAIILVTAVSLLIVLLAVSSTF